MKGLIELLQPYKDFRDPLVTWRFPMDTEERICRQM
jgi:hypothetical protein